MEKGNHKSPDTLQRMVKNTSQKPMLLKTGLEPWPVTLFEDPHNGTPWCKGGSPSRDPRCQRAGDGKFDEGHDSVLQPQQEALTAAVTQLGAILCSY